MAFLPEPPGPAKLVCLVQVITNSATRNAGLACWPGYGYEYSYYPTHMIVWSVIRTMPKSLRVRVRVSRGASNPYRTGKCDWYEYRVP
eukprot:scaffold645608_cov39-Prasinocladus_malaysianus.AAC.1